MCAAGPAARAGVLVGLAQRAGWTVRVAATPHATRFLDLDELERLSGAPVRYDFRPVGDPGPTWTGADAVIVAPASFNSVNKLAAGICDTYALTLVADLIGRARPITVVPFVNTVLASRRPFLRAMDSLRDEGVHIIFDRDDWEPHPPGEGDRRLADFPWARALTSITGR
ncbi:MULTISPECIES: flavoprotein [Actinoplanes]|uniref:flavoprotein n=1 Tax=Actinoplanes TaxID=1865 RepID=UPI0005F2ED15|nr:MULTISPECIES: flavoprotein [Actinoplanes]